MAVTGSKRASAARRVMLITGGSRGIGAATARLAAREGYDVALTYRQQAEQAAAVCSDIEAAGSQSLAVAVDLTNDADIERLWQTVIDSFGTVHALVNNAGTLEQQMPFSAMDGARLRRVFAANTIGPMLCASEAVRHMSVAGGGSGGVIVNVSSIAARLGSPGEYIDYAASKAALDGFTTGLAKEVGGDGIRVNSVRPGSIETDIHAAGGEPDRVSRVARSVPMQRGGKPAEIAEAIIWLCSDKASYANGTILEVGGGL